MTDILFGMISLAIAGGIFLAIRTVINVKLKHLKGTQKMLGLITIGIVISESVYLGLNFDLFRLATEVIASVGVAFALVAWSLQNSLKNTVAGIGIYLNREIDIGDVIEIDDNKGVIIEFHLTKITAMTEEGSKMFIPNQIIHQEIIRIHHKTKRNTNL